MRRALDETQIDGIKTNISYLTQVLADSRFQAGEIDVEFVERHLIELEAQPATPIGATA
jgi:biotin carboxylase